MRTQKKKITVTCLVINVQKDTPCGMKFCKITHNVSFKYSVSAVHRDQFSLRAQLL